MDEAAVLKKVLNSKGWVPSWSYSKKIFEISPEEFLKYAKSDLRTKSKKGSINALGNAKRAIDSQIDLILIKLGFGKIAKKENWRFPKKASFLNEFGIITPSVLHKYNTLRNKTEHEYKNPTREAVEDAIGVAELFIEATKNFSVKEHEWFESELSPPKNLLTYYLKGNTYFMHSIMIKYHSDQRSFLLNLHSAKLSKGNAEPTLFTVQVGQEHPKFTILLKKYISEIKQM